MMTNSAFLFCLQILSLTHEICANQSVLRGFKRSCFSKNNVKKMWLFGEKLMGLPKNGPTSSTSPRLVSPESSPPKRDTPFVIIRSPFYRKKTQKVNKIDDFVILCDHQLFQHDHVQFTFEDPRILQNPPQSLNYIFGKYTKKYKNKQYFLLTKNLKNWIIFVQNLSNLVSVTAYRKAK